MEETEIGTFLVVEWAEWVRCARYDILMALFGFPELTFQRHVHRRLCRSDFDEWWNMSAG